MAMKNRQENAKNANKPFGLLGLFLSTEPRVFQKRAGPTAFCNTSNNTLLKLSLLISLISTSLPLIGCHHLQNSKRTLFKFKVFSNN
jgi:hypothetical protein